MRAAYQREIGSSKHVGEVWWEWWFGGGGLFGGRLDKWEALFLGWREMVCAGGGGWRGRLVCGWGRFLVTRRVVGSFGGDFHKLLHLSAYNGPSTPESAFCTQHRPQHSLQSPACPTAQTSGQTRTTCIPSLPHYYSVTRSPGWSLLRTCFPSLLDLKHSNPAPVHKSQSVVMHRTI